MLPVQLPTEDYMFSAIRRLSVFVFLSLILISSVSFAQRQLLSQNTTFYVRVDGSDSNDGSADDPADAFLTIQHAVDVYQSIDCAGFDVTIQVEDGAYTKGVLITSRVGAGNLYLTGNPNTPANCWIAVTGGNAISIQGHPQGSVVILNGFKLSTITSGECLFSQGGAQVFYKNIEFGSCAGFHLNANEDGIFYLIGPCKISGGAIAHIVAQVGGKWLNIAGPVTITIVGTPAFSQAFCWAVNLGFAGITNQITWSGSATGKRYESDNLSVITTYSAGANYLPGSIAGTTMYGGVYI